MSRKHRNFDVAVIGAGPAGSSAAFYLARQGHRVLLIERDAFPRHKVCGDGLTPTAVRLLNDMGLEPALKRFKAVRGVDIRITTAARRRESLAFDEGGRSAWYGLVAPRLQLDALICRAAQEAGVTLWERALVRGARLSDGLVEALTVERGGVMVDVSISRVVAADGANSRFASQVGLDISGTQVGYAARQYFALDVDFGDLLRFYLPVVDPNSCDIARGYGWAFPCGDRVANIGLGLYPQDLHEKRINLRRIFETFVAGLRREDPVFARMRALGPLRGAPLRTGGSAQSDLLGGIIVAGDAAGLVETFTGEGIGSALQSGKDAAACVNETLNPSATATTRLLPLEASPTKPMHGFARSDRSYAFFWKLLEARDSRSHSMFPALRRELMRTAFLGHAVHETPDVGLSDPVDLHDDVARVAALVSSALGSRLPLLSRHGLALVDRRLAWVRSALLLCCSRLGTAPHHACVASAASIELAYLARVCHRSISELPSVGDDDRCGDSFALLAGDYFLVKSYEVAAKAGAAVSQRVSAVMAEVWATMLTQEISARPTNYTEHLMQARRGVAAFYSLSCELGARLAGAREEVVAAVAAFGEDIGVALSFREGGWTTSACEDVDTGRYFQVARSRLACLDSTEVAQALQAVALAAERFDRIQESRSDIYEAKVAARSEYFSPPADACVEP